MGMDEHDPLRRFPAEADEHLFRDVRFDDRLKERVLRELYLRSGEPATPAASKAPAEPPAPAKAGRRKRWSRRLSAVVSAAVLAGLVLASLPTIQNMIGVQPKESYSTLGSDMSLLPESSSVEQHGSGGAGESGEITDVQPLAETDDMSGNFAPSPVAAPQCDAHDPAADAAPAVPVPGEHAADASARSGPGAADNAAEANASPADTEPSSAVSASPHATVVPQGAELADVEEAKAWFGEDLLVADYIPAPYRLERIRGYADPDGRPAYVCFRYAAGQQVIHIVQSRQQASAELPPGERVDAEEFLGVFADAADAADGARTELHGIRHGIRFVVSGSLSREEALKVARSLSNGEAGSAGDS